MGIFRTLLWFILFVFFTFCFVVLFQYGINDFVPGFQKEFERVSHFVKETAQPAKKKADNAKP